VTSWAGANCLANIQHHVTGMTFDQGRDIAVLGPGQEIAFAALGTSSKTVVGVELERIANALRQRDGTIDPAELDTVIAIVSGTAAKERT
jgi:hypothetical protein